MKLISLLVVTTLLSALVIGNSFSQNKQFYPSVVHIMRSKICLAVMIAEVVLSFTLFVKTTTQLFFSHLIGNESEHLRDFLWPSVLDTCFVFAVFGRNSDYFFYFRLFCLFYFKIMHFMAHQRVNSMAAVVRMPPLFHFRFIALLSYLAIVDSFQIGFSLRKLIKSGLSLEILYLFEYSILVLNLIHAFGEYIIEYIDQRTAENGWEAKVVFQNYLELIVFTCKSVSHLLVLRFLIKLKILPIFLARNIVNNFRKVKESLNKVVLCMRAIARVNRFPKPTPEDLRQDSMCSICRDEIQSPESAKKLFCKHIFHIPCLKAWLRRQQRCPTCRSDVTKEQNANQRGGQQNNQRREERIGNQVNQQN